MASNGLDRGVAADTTVGLLTILFHVEHWAVRLCPVKSLTLYAGRLTAPGGPPAAIGRVARGGWPLEIFHLGNRDAGSNSVPIVNLYVPMSRCPNVPNCDNMYLGVLLKRGPIVMPGLTLMRLEIGDLPRASLTSAWGGEYLRQPFDSVG